MPTFSNSIQDEILAVEETLDSFPHKIKRVMGLFRSEIERAFHQWPGNEKRYEQIAVHRLMSLRLIEQLLDKRTHGKSVTADERHLTQLLFSAVTRFAESMAELEPEFGILDFSANLPEMLVAEFGLNSSEAWIDACNIRASKVYAEDHREEIIAEATAKGLIPA